MSNPSFDRHLDNQINERFCPEPEQTEFCEGCDRLTDAENDGQTCTDCGWDYGATPLEMAEKFQAQIEALKEENKKLKKQLAEELDDDGIPLSGPRAHSQNLPCAVCGDAPSLPASLACGDCVEGGPR